MPKTDSLEAIRRDLHLIVKRMDAMAAHLDPPPEFNVDAMKRTDAVVWALTDSGVPMSPREITDKLTSAGRDDDNEAVGITAYDLAEAKNPRIRRVGRGRYEAI